MGTLQFARAHAHERNLGFKGVNGVSLGPDPNPRVGQGRGPPRTVSPQVVTWVFPREFKKKEKINVFLAQVSTQIYYT